MDVKVMLKAVRAKNTYSQNTVLILLSKGLIVLFTFGVTPLIARFYSPDQYGTYALLNSIVVVFSLLSTWSLTSELIICKQKELKPLITFILQLSFFCSLLLTSAILIFKDQLFDLLSLELNRNYLFLIPVYVIVISITEIFATLNIREKKFKTNIIVNTTDNISNKSTTLTLGALSLTKFGLIVGDMLGKVLNTIVQSFNRKTGTQDLFSLKGFFQFNMVPTLVKKYKSYWKYQAPSLFIQKFSHQLIVWLLAIFFSKTELGHYTMAISLLSIPLLLFSNSFQPIITSKLAEIKESDDRGKIFDKAVLVTSLVSLTVYSTIFLVCDWFVPIYLSDKWMESIIFIKILCFSFGMTLIGNSISGLYIVFGQQKLNFYIKVAFSVVLFASLTLFLAAQNALILAIVLYAIINLVEEVVRIIFLRKAILNNNL